MRDANSSSLLAEFEGEDEVKCVAIDRTVRMCELLKEKVEQNKERASKGATDYAEDLSDSSLVVREMLVGIHGLHKNALELESEKRRHEAVVAEMAAIRNDERDGHPEGYSFNRRGSRVEANWWSGSA